MVNVDKTIHELDAVALTQDLPKDDLFAGEVGTVVYVHGNGNFLIEFANKKGESTNILTIEEDKLLKLQYPEREEMFAE